MNWGSKITIAFLAFAMFLGVLIYRVYQAKIHLVADDYYEQELAYQEQIDKLENEQALEKSVDIELKSELKILSIRFPKNLAIESGHLELYRPSDASLDRKWKLKLDQDNTQILSTKNLASGLWQVKIEWRDQSNAYLKQENLYLP